MAPESPRICMRAVAEAAGVTVSTVSRALRNDSQIAKKTALRIQNIAGKMGYRPDPALSALAAYRSTRRPVHHYDKIAVLCHRSEEQGLPPHLNVQGIRHRAAQLGFDADVFQIAPDEAQQQRLTRILYSRGIRGVIVMPLPWLPTAFDWEKFSVVGLGENAVRLRINYVSYDHDAAIGETYRQLRLRGYRRIGFCNLRESEERNRHLFLAAYLKCLHLDGGKPIAPYLYAEREAWSPVSWVKENHFDAVISSAFFIKKLAASFKIPQALGVAGFCTHLGSQPDLSFSSYIIDGNALGSAAVDFLQGLIQKNLTGLPDARSQHSVIVRGYWNEGSTIRPVPFRGKRSAA